MQSRLWDEGTTLQQLEEYFRHAINNFFFIHPELNSSYTLTQNDLNDVSKIEQTFVGYAQYLNTKHIEYSQKYDFTLINEGVSFDDKLQFLALHFPHLANFLFSQIKANTDMLQTHVTRCLEQFLKFAVGFRDNTDELIAFLLNHPDEFKRLIKDVNDLTTLIGILPNHAANILAFVLKNTSEFTRLITNMDNLEFLKTFCFTKISNMWKEIYASKLDEEVMDEHPIDAFLLGYFIKHGDAIQKVYSEQIIQKYYDRFIDHVLNNISEFDRLITTDDNLHKLVELNPDHPILKTHGKKNLQAFCAWRNSENDIKKTARWLTVATASQHTLFLKKCPQGILVTIAAQARSYNASHTDTEAEQVAYKTLKQGIPENIRPRR